MKRQLIISAMTILLLAMGCSKEIPSDFETPKSNLVGKEITAFDGTGKYFIKLIVSTENQELLNRYSDKSFKISFDENLTNPNDNIQSNELPIPSNDELNITLGESQLPKNVNGLRISYVNISSQRTNVVRWVTVNLFAFAPKNFISIYNKTSTNSSVTFFYSNSTSSSSGWVNSGNKTVAAKKDATFCRMGVKQIKAQYTYDANSGSYDFFTWQYYNKCP